MNKTESESLFDKIAQGIHLANKRLIEQTAKENGELVISRQGKITRVKAKDFR